VKILVCGDRNWKETDTIFNWLAKFHKSSTIIHGNARGADTIGGKIAEKLGMLVLPYPANWEKYGKAAGPIRNQQMLDSKPDLVLAFHSDLKNSKGTKDMVQRALMDNIDVFVITGKI
jgi:hypothetical protein